MCVNVEPCASGALFSVASGQGELVSDDAEVLVAKKSSLLLSVSQSVSQSVSLCVCPVATQPVTPVEPLSSAATVASATAPATVTATISTSVNTTTTTTATTTSTATTTTTTAAAAAAAAAAAEHECSYLVHAVGSYQQLYTARPLLLSRRVSNERCTGTMRHARLSNDVLYTLCIFCCFKQSDFIRGGRLIGNSVLYRKREVL